MHPEAAFLSGYALSLVAVAAGLATLGRRSAQPWSSRVLAAGRPSDAQRAGADEQWPHSEVPIFHLVLSGVVLAAAVLLTAVSLARHHRPVEVVVQVALLAFIVMRILRVGTQLRAGLDARPP